MLKVFSYLKDRLDERATWLAIGVGITGAAALTSPWDYVAFAVAVIGALVPGKEPNG